MRRFGFKILIVIVLIILGLKVTDRMFPTRVFLEDTLKVFEKSEESFQIMIFGSSHAYCSYDPRVFESQLGSRSIVFSSGSQRLSTTQFIIEEVLQKSKPELIVIDIFSNSLGSYPSEKQTQFQLQALDHFPNSLKKIQLMDSLFGTPFLPFAMSSTLRFHGKWNKLSLNDYSRKLYLAPRHDFYNGFKTTLTTYSDSIEKDFLATHEKYKKLPNDLSPEEKSVIDSLVWMLDKKDVDYIFVNSASRVSNMNITYERYTELIKTYLENKGIIFLDINSKADSLGLTRYHYRDPDHLNQKGALIVSEYLSSYLGANYNLSTAKLPKAHFNRYKHIKENFVNAEFYRRFDNLELQGNKIKSVAMYRVTGHKYEALLELEDTIFNHFDVTFQYSKNDFVDSYLMTLTEQDIISYNGRKFAIASLLYKQKDIKEMVLFGGKEDKSILTISDNKMTDNLYNIEKNILLKELNIKLVKNVSVEYIKIIERRNKYILKLKFSDSIKYLDKSYNLAVHIIPTKSDKQKINKRNAERKMFFDNVDKAVEKQEDTLVAEVITTIKSIDRIKIFLYYRGGYTGIIGTPLIIDGGDLTNNK